MKNETPNNGQGESALDKKFLCTASANHYTPAFCRWVEIDSKGFVDGETPVEDFGMYLLLDKPISSDSAEKLFLALIGHGEGEADLSALNADELQLLTSLTQ
jgi:hypothetical protein